MDELDIDDAFKERPWIKWENVFEVEAWIDGYNRDMRKLITDPRASGYGICFILEAGGEIYMHTTQDGAVLLDVPPEAEWIAPLLTAITRHEAPGSQIWMLPMDKLTQLILGLSGLVKATRMILNHDFGFKKAKSPATRLG